MLSSPAVSRRSLPDCSRLPMVSAEVWHRFRARLEEIGFTEEYAGRLTKVGDGMPGATGAPLRNWHARRLHEPAAWIARMFMLNDPVRAADARAALGPVLPDVLAEAGLIEPAGDDNVVSPFQLVVANELYFLCDDLTRGRDAVMGPGATTGVLWQASQPTHRAERILDLGCGAGNCALLLAGNASSVVGTDINPRAIALAKINATLNGIANVEYREGDLLSPVADETFDLIVSQPPYFARPRDFDERVYLFGGARGDELPLRILAEVPRYLNPGGRAVVLSQWPTLAGERLEDRIAAAVAPAGASVLLLRYAAHDLDNFAAHYAAVEHPDLGEDFARAAVRCREHLEEVGIRGLALGLVVVHRSAPETRWTGVVHVPQSDADCVTSSRIDKLVAAREMAADARRLLDARLRVPLGAVFAREYQLGATARPEVVARFPKGALVGTIELGPSAQLLLTLLHEAPDVRGAIQRFADDEKIAFDEAARKLLPPIREALLAGMLEPLR